jgi:hypothetical protein
MIESAQNVGFGHDGISRDDRRLEAKPLPFIALLTSSVRRRTAWQTDLALSPLGLEAKHGFNEFRDRALRYGS